jgi:hypothetical protein
MGGNMAEGKPKRSGRFSLRVSPEIHDELVSIGEVLGLDITTLVNVMIREALPTFRARANELSAKLAATNPAALSIAAQMMRMSTKDIKSAEERKMVEKMLDNLINKSKGKHHD